MNRFASSKMKKNSKIGFHHRLNNGQSTENTSYLFFLVFNNFFFRNTSHDGKLFSTEMYICRFKRRENNNCKVIIKVQRNNTGTIVILQSGDHEHQEQEEKQRLTEEQRQLMRELISYRLTAGQIQDELLVCF
jgi:hypothetical protein